MRTFQLALWALALLALGCRSTPNSVLLERDLRMQEDELWQLKNCLEDCQAAREAAQQEILELKRQLDRGEGDNPREPAYTPPSRSSEPRSRSRRSETPRLEAPTIELPEVDTPGVDMSPGVETTPGSDDSSVVEGRPTSLVINKRVTGGLDRDGQGGDEGIYLLIEPRDASGQLVKSQGTVSVVVMDPSLGGAAQRVARWDFAADELPSHFRSTSLGRGLQFELPWPGQKPKNRDLQLFVRFTTESGDKLEANAPLDIHTASGARENRETNNRTPGSRLKSRRANSASLGSPAGSEEEIEDRPAPARRPREPVQQATRPDRPTWKPYR